MEKGERERVWFIRTSNSTRLFITFNVKSLSRAQPVAKDALKANSTSRTRDATHVFSEAESWQFEND